MKYEVNNLSRACKERKRKKKKDTARTYIYKDKKNEKKRMN